MVDESDLPELQSIELGSGAFSGNSSQKRMQRIIGTNEYVYNNTLKMTSWSH